MIEIVTETMSQMAVSSRTACDEMESAVSRLNQVQQHDDWKCKERDLINEGIEAIKKHQKTLQTMMEEFAVSVETVAAAFKEQEERLANSAQTLEEMLSRALSVSTERVSTVGTAASSAAEYVSASTLVSGGLENSALGNLASSACICDFDTVDFSK